MECRTTVEHRSTQPTLQRPQLLKKATLNRLPRHLKLKRLVRLKNQPLGLRNRHIVRLLQCRDLPLHIRLHLRIRHRRVVGGEFYIPDVVDDADGPELVECWEHGDVEGGAGC